MLQSEERRNDDQRTASSRIAFQKWRVGFGIEARRHELSAAPGAWQSAVREAKRAALKTCGTQTVLIQAGAGELAWEADLVASPRKWHENVRDGEAKQVSSNGSATFHLPLNQHNHHRFRAACGSVPWQAVIERQEIDFIQFRQVVFDRLDCIAKPELPAFPTPSVRGL
ncbi:hypothetical protein ACWGS9_34155 [Bradyrhizobium sp. Arg314]